MRLAATITCLAVLALPAFTAAQTEPDAENCKDSALLSRLPGCWIESCETKDFDEAEFATSAAQVTGDAPATKQEGAKERVNYFCPPRVSVVQIHRNVENALKAGGYTIAFSGGSGDLKVVTGQKDGVWITTRAQPWNDQSMYELVAVRTKAMAQEMKASADAWAAEIARTGRVAVYGINFDTGKAAVRPDSEPVLQEIVKLLKAQPTLKLKIEGHTDNVGAKAANQKLSEERAASVVAWLAAHGIDKARLASAGFGDSKPVGENTTEAGRAKNRRVELVKM